MTETSRSLDVVLVWHMHQPDYRDASSGDFRLPWVYLHALKDYSDMAAHLEAHPAMRAVVNLVPVLVDQLEDYANQFASGVFRDPLLRVLARPIDVPFTPEERALVLGQCFPVNRERLVAPYPGYQRLYDLAHAAGREGDPLRYLSDRFLTDLCIWYHLAWTGETVRRAHPLLGEMMALGGGFGEAHRRALFAVVQEVVVGIVPRYRRLADAGLVELTTSPWKHPIGPLLIDFACAREARPDLPLPSTPRYPGGLERCEYQIGRALDSHATRFGGPPAGLWPAEGAVSNAFVHALGNRGVRWTASGSQVLARSLARAGIEPTLAALCRAYRMPSVAPDVVCLFRDDALSDLIGFEYRRWHSGDAARHFVGQLEALAARLSEHPDALVTVIVDGENAWEYYPYNGFYFLTELYARLSQHPVIRTRTVDGWLRQAEQRRARGADPVAELPCLSAGSWVYGDLSTWIGAPDKNRAWDLLCTAKSALDDALVQARLDKMQRREATHLLAVAESSDWFWWFGDHNPAESVAHFDRLFRATLARIYALIGTPPPAALTEPVSRGRVDAQFEGAIRRSS